MIMRIQGLIAAAMLCALPPARAENQVFKVGPIAAARGEARSGVLEIPAGVDAGTQVPITVIHGSKPGPVLALVAGTHGYEYSPVLALNRMKPKINPKKLSGTVILVHVANVPSFLKRTIYYNPWDWKNLNRVYPGKPDGTNTERIAYAITKEVIERSDYLLDLHCGDGNEALLPYAYWMTLDDEKLNEKAKQLVLAFGLSTIVVDKDRPRDPKASAYTSNTAMTRNKPAITIESGQLGSMSEEWIAPIERGVMNVLKHLKMMDGEATYVTSPRWIDRSEVLRSPATGVLWPKGKLGSAVKKGELLAVVHDFFGNTLAEVRSPFDGVLLYILGTPPINADEPVAFVGQVRVSSNPTGN
jgi:predicted deacylase